MLGVHYNQLKLNGSDFVVFSNNKWISAKGIKAVKKKSLPIKCVVNVIFSENQQFNISLWLVLSGE